MSAWQGPLRDLPSLETAAFLAKLSFLCFKIHLPLNSLLTDASPEAKKFRHHIRQYNAALAFTSLGAKFDHSLLDGNGPYVFKLHGGLYHNHGALIPNDGTHASYAQLYIYDPDMALQQRMNRNSNISGPTMSDLQEMLLQHNPFVPVYRPAAEQLRLQGQAQDIQARLTYKAHTDPRRYNIPTANEIAIVLPGDGVTPQPRDIILLL